MITFEDKNDNGVIELNEDTTPEGEEEIVQRELYYPAGSVWGEGDPKRTRSVNQNWWEGAPAPADVTSQDYKYNGKELDKSFGLNWYFYGARMYDPAVGRFTGVDPIAEQFAFVSVYNYAENRVPNGIDLWGLQFMDANDARIYIGNGSNSVKWSSLNRLSRASLILVDGSGVVYNDGSIGSSLGAALSLSGVGYHVTQLREIRQGDRTTRPKWKVPTWNKGGNSGQRRVAERAARRVAAANGSSQVPLAPNLKGGLVSGVAQLLQIAGEFSTTMDLNSAYDQNLLANDVLLATVISYANGDFEIPASVQPYDLDSYVASVANYVFSGEVNPVFRDNFSEEEYSSIISAARNIIENSEDVDLRDGNQ